MTTINSDSKASQDFAAKLKAKTDKSETIFNAWWIAPVGVVSGHMLATYTVVFYHSIPSVLVLWTVLMGAFGTFGITAGYHRLWSHASFAANWPVRLFLAIAGSAAWQGSIHWWVLRHRIHHRWTDTKYDPYNAKRGFWYSHFGWVMEKPWYNPKAQMIDMSDIKNDWVASSQRVWYPFVVIFFATVFPTFIGWLYNDPLGGFLWVGCVGRILSWNSIFFVNSYCHWKGEQPYDEDISATTSFLLGIWSFGESNHNGHHVFAKSYKHGLRWWDMDLTRDILWFWGKIGLVWNLFTYDDHLVKELELDTRIRHLEKQIQYTKKQLQHHMDSVKDTELYAPPLDTLPSMTMSDFHELAHAPDTVKDKMLMVIDDIVYDAKPYASSHPGGVNILRAYSGRNASKAFNGGVNTHSKAAKHLLARYAVGKIVAEGESAASTNRFYH